MEPKGVVGAIALPIFFFWPRRRTINYLGGKERKVTLNLLLSNGNSFRFTPPPSEILAMSLIGFITFFVRNLTESRKYMKD